MGALMVVQGTAPSLSLAHARAIRLGWLAYRGSIRRRGGLLLSRSQC
ncbi:hypothetical protein ABTJ99_20325 [Acinetobacter baumannii]